MKAERPNEGGVQNSKLPTGESGSCTDRQHYHSVAGCIRANVWKVGPTDNYIINYIDYIDYADGWTKTS